MAYVYIDFHRDRGRVRPHIQYIADREHSRGLRGLGQEFRQLNGDVEKVVRLFHEHAGRVRRHVSAGDQRAVRDVPFHEMIFTLPTDLARREAGGAGLLLGRTGTPLRDVFLRALSARTDGRRRLLHAARYALGLPVPVPHIRLMPRARRLAEFFIRMRMP